LAPLVLWQRDEGGNWAEILRLDTTRAGYDCCVPLALFNPAGDLVALEESPSFEAQDLKVVVYDRRAGEVLFSLPEHELAAWVSDEVLLTSEAQYDTRLTRWNVRMEETEVVGGREMGDNAYAPGGLIYARPNDQEPYYVRGVQVHALDMEQAIDRDIYDSDVFQIAWSADGRLVAVLASNGVIVVWPLEP
jgi:hypothetical protein